MTNASIQLEPARDAIAYAAARRLFSDYAAWLGVDLSFQGFEAELAGLPGKYAPPEADAAGGELIVAWRDAEDGSREAVGCVAVRPFADDACEMKRLWVMPEARGSGLGVRLGEAILDVSRRLGYRRMLLDTLRSMSAANRLYQRLGFREVPPYYHNPHPDVVYYARDL
ncbi:MAG: GNAT family N-acetyltransferase [Myxococcales bacterium]|nr:GNAT family N-acetyltransferase [Myxococcales bacterium]